MSSPTYEQILTLTEKLSSNEIHDLIEHLQTHIEIEETEDEWDARTLRDSLGKALRADGTIDFDLYYQQHELITLGEAFPEYVDVEPSYDTSKI